MDGPREHHLKAQKAVCFLSYVEYRPNTNTAILWKTGHAKGKSHMRGGGKRRKLR
jgi:hypothetical protein